MPPEIAEGSVPAAPAVPLPLSGDEGTSVHEASDRIAAMLAKGDYLGPGLPGDGPKPEAPAAQPRDEAGRFASPNAEQPDPAPAQGDEADTGAQPTSEHEQTTGQDDTGAQPTSEPPPSLPAPVRAKWKDLPEDTRSALAEHETSRNREVSRRLEEAARERSTAVETATAATKKALEEATRQFTDSLRMTAPLLVQEFEEEVKAFNAKYPDGPPSEDDLTEFVKYQQAKEKVAHRQGRLNAWAKSWEEQADKTTKEAKAKADERRAECHRALATAWPDDFGEEQKALGSYRKIGEWLMDGKNFKTGQGFPRDMVLALDNPAIYEIVRDAMSYRALKAANPGNGAKPAAATDTGQRKPAPQLLKPGAGGQKPPSLEVPAGVDKERYTASRKRLAETGGIDDGAAAIAALGYR